MNYLNQEERDGIFNQLTESQQTYIQQYLKRGKKTEYANIMAKEKASDSLEAAYEWEFEDYIDGGPKWRSREPKLLCECGRSLRHQYVVKNSISGVVKKFGIHHFEEHVGIPPHLAMKIKKGLERIDFEMDEILMKVRDHWELASAGLARIPDDVEIPNDVQEHFDLGLPLLDRQINRLREKVAAFYRKQDEERERRAESRTVVNDRRATKSYSRPNKSHSFQQSAKPLGKHATYLTNSGKQGIVAFLRETAEELVWASEVCEYLIENHGVSAATYSSGMYRVFGDVCIVLQEIIQRGGIVFVEKNPNDRLYRIVDKSRIEDYITDGNGQISLF